MRQQEYPGSEIIVEQTLQPGSNYRRYVVSYRSDGLKIYALMTIPAGPKPAGGWPVIFLNHGTIEPSLHRTTERYIYYIDTFARNGYIVFKTDYRGHGSSEGTPINAYTSPAYTTDVLNAVASVKRHPEADPNRLGMWGHSMGGQLTLRTMVVSRDIKAGVIWGGSVGPYPDIHARGSGPAVFALHPWRRQLIDRFGTPEGNPEFWAAMSPNSYLAELSGPIELHHAANDDVVPVAASQSLVRQAAAAGQKIELFTYPNENHNINLIPADFALAMQRTVAFFDRHVKAAQ